MTNSGQVFPVERSEEEGLAEAGIRGRIWKKDASEDERFGGTRQKDSEEEFGRPDYTRLVEFGGRIGKKNASEDGEGSGE